MTYLLPGKRAKDLEALAARHTFEYQETDRRISRSFRLFAQAETRNLPENVLHGQMRSYSFCAFDYTYLEDFDARRARDESRPWIPYESPAQFTCAIVDIGADVPETVLNPRADKRLFSAALELDAPDKALGKLFQFWSAVPGTLKWLAEEKFAEFLANTRGKFGFELREGSLMCVASDVRAPDVLGLIAMSVTAAERLPTGLLKAYQQHGHTDSPPSAVLGTWEDVEVPAPTSEPLTDDAPDDGPTPADDAVTQRTGLAPITDLREARTARSRLKAGRVAKGGTTAASRGPSSPERAPASPQQVARPATHPDDSTADLPAPPSAEHWQQWLEEHPDEVAGWAADVNDPPDWEQLSEQERESELEQLAAMADEGLITPEEFEEARRYLDA